MVWNPNLLVQLVQHKLGESKSIFSTLFYQWFDCDSHTHIRKHTHTPHTYHTNTHTYHTNQHTYNTPRTYCTHAHIHTRTKRVPTHIHARARHTHTHTYIQTPTYEHTQTHTHKHQQTHTHTKTWLVTGHLVAFVQLSEREVCVPHLHFTIHSTNHEHCYCE